LFIFALELHVHHFALNKEYLFRTEMSTHAFAFVEGRVLIDHCKMRIADADEVFAHSHVVACVAHCHRVADECPPLTSFGEVARHLVVAFQVAEAGGDVGGHAVAVDVVAALVHGVDGTFQVGKSTGVVVSLHLILAQVAVHEGYVEFRLVRYMFLHGGRMTMDRNQRSERSRLLIEIAAR
jgi:hypothetical protein